MTLADERTFSLAAIVGEDRRAAVAAQLAGASPAALGDADVVLIELDGDHTDHKRALDAVSGRRDDAILVVLVDAIKPGTVRTLLRHGARVIVLSDTAERTLRSSLRAALDGQVALPWQAVSKSATPHLSARERQVLALVVMDLGNAEIARQLVLAEPTVKTHLASVFRKLGVSSRAAARDLVLDPDTGLGLDVLAITPDHAEAQALRVVPDPAQLVRGTITVPRHVAHRAFAEECLVLDLNTGRYHRLNASGARMLTVLEDTGSVRETVERLGAEFDVGREKLLRDVLALSTRLIALGLLEFRAG